MTEATGDKSPVPVWTLTTGAGQGVPALTGATTMTAERLAEMRSALAAFAESPIVTLEAHPLPKGLDRNAGISLDATSPLAQGLATLVSRTAKSTPSLANMNQATGVLYRMVVPAKVAAQVGKGMVSPMVSKAASGGIYSALVGSSGIAAQATFVPVAAEMATAGAVGGAASTAAVGVASAGALTVAAPLILLAVAVGVSAYADHQRQKAIENITGLLKQLQSDNLNHERGELEGCRDAIEKATAVLLDQGKIGASLGLDSAVHVISTATELASHRTRTWQTRLNELADGPVSVDQLLEAFPGIDQEGGEFRAHLEFASLAIALRRRVIVLQAVEHSQGDPSKPFERFVRSLKADQQRVDELETNIASVLVSLASLHLQSPRRLRDKLMTRGQVDELLAYSYKLREFGDQARPGSQPSDVVIEIARNSDGTLLVLPATAQ